MSFSDHDEPKKTDDDDDDDDDDEEDEEDEEDEDEEDDEADWAECTKCGRAVEKNASIRLYMSRGRMTDENFVCELCAAEKMAAIRDRKAAKKKGTTG